MPPDRAPVSHERADSRASHAARDLHDSFTVIKTAVQLLHCQARLQRLTSEGLLTRLEVIEATAMRMSLLVREMLDSARMAQGAPPLLECRPSDLQALAERMLAYEQQVTERHDLRRKTTERAVIGPWMVGGWGGRCRTSWAQGQPAGRAGPRGA